MASMGKFWEEELELNKSMDIDKDMFYNIPFFLRFYYNLRLISKRLIKFLKFCFIGLPSVTITVLYTPF